MLIQYFRRLYTLTPLLLLMVGGILWAELLLDTEPMKYAADKSAGPLYSLLTNPLQQYQKLGWLLAFLFVAFQAIMLNQVVTTQGVVDRHSFLISLLYMMLMSASKNLLGMHPVLFSNFFLILALHRILKMYNQDEQHIDVFNVGMFISLAGLFYAPAWLFFPLLIIALFVFYMVDMRSFLAAIIGFASPFLFLATYFYWQDIPLATLLDFSFVYGGVWLIFNEVSLMQKVILGFLSGMMALTIFHLVAIHIPDKPIRMRKRLWVLVYFFFIALLISLFTGITNHYHAALMCVPTAILLAGFFHQIERKMIAEVMLTILILLILADKYLVFIYEF